MVFYRLHPDPHKIDDYCGNEDRSYVVRHVAARGDRRALGRAVKALFRRYWEIPSSRLDEVSVENGLATISLSSMRDLDFAGTSCGGVGFLGSISRTAFQFESIEALQVHLRGNCRSFGEYMQSARCETFTRRDI